jgi:hypothetical protein
MATNGDSDSGIKKFLIPASRITQERAVARELNRLRPQFRFSDAELRRLRQPRRKRLA